MTSIASDVAWGTCSSVESRYTDDKKQILTYVTLSGVEALKGREGGAVTFVLLGGTVGDHTFEAVGAPTFKVGEEMVVFLRRMPGSERLTRGPSLWILGLGQGKWAVSHDRTTREATATVSTGAASVIEKAGRPVESALPFSELVARVRAAAAKS
jgi:hypothetical protein